MGAPRILAFAGSLRRESYNKKLVRIAAEAARGSGAEVTLLDLRDYPLPVYDGDLEQEEGVPENALRLKELFVAHEGLLISSPEYNSSIPGAFKNVLDWVSRPVPGEKSLAAFEGKLAALLSASPGRLGGLRGLAALRPMLENIGVLVLPGQVAVSSAHEAFDEEGLLHDPKQSARVTALAQEFVEVLRKLRG